MQLSVQSGQSDLRARDATDGPVNHIVVGIDFTEVSLAAAQWVGRHLARDAMLTLVHVIPRPPRPNVRVRSHRAADSESKLRRRVRLMSGALRGLAGAIGRTGTRVEVRVGDPAVQLPAYASLVDADLLVVGGNSAFHAAPHHETATTDRLLQQLTRPVLVARNVQSPPQAVLVTLAGNATSSVLAAGRMVAAPTDARVVTLRLADRESPGDASALMKPRIPVASEQARMIIDVAREVRADVIVIARPTSPADADDTVASAVARTAPCSVLVVPYRTEPRPRGSTTENVEPAPSELSTVMSPPIARAS